jgi:zinc transport system substrate-binding protein
MSCTYQPARAVRVVSLVASLAIVTTACVERADGTASRADREGVLSVVASLYPLAFAAERVGGESVTVETLTPPGAEPHDLELTPDALVAIAEADVVVFLGGGFQPAVEEAVDAEADGVTADVLDGLDPLTAIGDEPGGGTQVDPHVWLDPRRFAEVVDRIGSALAEARPADDATFRVNARALRDELEALDGEFRRVLAECETRLMITNHAAFGYLADAYGLEVHAISGLTPGSEPDPARIAELAQLARTEGVTVIFTEDLLSPEAAETLAAEAGLRTAVLSPLEGLTESQAATGDDYVSVMRRNLETLRDGLDCT